MNDYIRIIIALPINVFIYGLSLFLALKILKLKSQVSNKKFIILVVCLVIANVLEFPLINYIDEHNLSLQFYSDSSFGLFLYLIDITFQNLPVLLVSFFGSRNYWKLGTLNAIKVTIVSFIITVITGLIAFIMFDPLGI